MTAEPPGPLARLDRAATAPIAAAGLIGGFAVAVGTGSRPAGGVVLAACGLTCIAVWARRDDRATTTLLTITGLAAFAGSHVLGRVIGSWPAVLSVSAATAGLCWWRSDSRRPAMAGARRAPALRLTSNGGPRFRREE